MRMPERGCGVQDGKVFCRPGSVDGEHGVSRMQSRAAASSTSSLRRSSAARAFIRWQAKQPDMPRIASPSGENGGI